MADSNNGFLDYVRHWAGGGPHAALVRWTPIQRALYVGTALGLVVCACIHLPTFVFLLSLLLLTLYGVVICIRVTAVVTGLLRRHTVRVSDEELQAVAAAELPVYTILIPAYHEAGMIPFLLESLESLDYPKEKLDVKLLLEADDEATLEATRQHTPPPWVEVLVVPEGEPKTKPRACNAGLAGARGEFLVIFDAEDRPEPDQLRKAVAAFRRMPANVVCLQARLNFYNAGENLITRWSALEYTAWFDLYLPGLHAIRSPIPLGGTSNHFRVSALRRLHGWDPYNVTEDCDLGIRLEWQGGETRILDSTTWEEAVGNWSSWLRQRSRWMKGYWQTHLCHTRDPLDGIRRLGLWKWLMMTTTVGGQVFSLLANPICWAMTVLWLFRRWPLYDPHAPLTIGFLAGAVALGLFNILFIVIHLLGAVRRRMFRLLPLVFLMPLYWIMVSVGAWRGFLQFFTFPFLWEKTQHGLFKIRPGPAAMPARDIPPSGAVLANLVSPHRDSGRFSGVRSATALIVLSAAIVVVAVLMPGWLGAYKDVQFASISLAGNGLECRSATEASWFGKTQLNLRLDLVKGTNVTPIGQAPAFRAIVFLKVWDGEWYQQVVDNVSFDVDRAAVTFSVPLETGWRGASGSPPWGPWCLRRIRETGVRLFGATDGFTAAILTAARAAGPRLDGALAATLLPGPVSTATYEVFEGRFQLSREYENPFDPDQIDVWAEFTAPNGKITRVPAFYTRDFRRSMVNQAEQLDPIGRPYWAARFAPAVPGEHVWRLEGRDHTGATFKSAAGRFTVSQSAHRGYVRVDRNDRRFFAFDNGDFFYPVPLNIRSPGDTRMRQAGAIAPLNEKGGTYVMEGFIDKMSASGITVGRMWMTPWWGGLEWRADWPGDHGLGFFNLQNAWRFDRILTHATEKGVLLELALNTHGPFTLKWDTEWPLNPYSAANGGFLRNPADVMTNEEAKRLFRNRFRYIAARYGASPNIFGWVLWIEGEVVNDDRDTLLEWHSEFARYLKSMDSGKHLISTEFNKANRNRAVMNLPEIEYSQDAAYSDRDGMEMHFLLAQRVLQGFDKPMLIEEYGGPWWGGEPAWLAREIHDGLWLGWMMPFSAAPMPWWWTLIFDNGLERHQRRFSEYAIGEDLRGEDWSFRECEIINASAVRARARVGKDRAYIWVHSSVVMVAAGNRSPHRVPRRGTGQENELFDAMKADPGAQFGPLEGVGVSLSGLGLEAGDYEVEFWDTWSTEAPRKQVFTLSEDNNMLRLPEISRDMAIKLKRVPQKNRKNGLQLVPSSIRTSAF